MVHKRNKKKKTIDKVVKIVYNLMANYETAVCATLVAYFFGEVLKWPKRRPC